MWNKISECGIYFGNSEGKGPLAAAVSIILEWYEEFWEEL
jgi:hypothetical protein